MNYQLKLLRLPNHENYVIMLARGSVDSAALKTIFTEMTQATQSLPDCKVLIDLQDARLGFEPADFESSVMELKLEQWHHNNKVALVLAPQPDHLKYLIHVTTYLSNWKINAAGFDSVTTAVNWLTDKS
jgi:hypothetical protein